MKTTTATRELVKGIALTVTTRLGVATQTQATPTTQRI